MYNPIRIRDNMYKIVFYTSHRGDSLIDKFLDSLQVKVRAKTEKWMQKLQENGPYLPRPYSDTLRNKIRELRVSHGSMEIRLLYFFWNRTYIVMVHGLIKKKSEVPEQDIERAIKLMNGFITRHGG